MTIRFRMSSIMVIMGPERPGLFALELGEIAEFDFVYRLIEWCFKPLLTVFQSYHGDSSHYSCFPGFHQYSDEWDYG